MYQFVKYYMKRNNNFFPTAIKKKKTLMGSGWTARTDDMSVCTCTGFCLTEGSGAKCLPVSWCSNFKIRTVD